MVGNKCLELRDQLRAAPGLDLCVDSLLDREQLLLLKACDLGLRSQLVLKVRKWRPSPKCKRLVKDRGAIGWIHVPGVRDQGSKPL